MRRLIIVLPCVIIALIAGLPEVRWQLMILGWLTIFLLNRIYNNIQYNERIRDRSEAIDALLAVALTVRQDQSHNQDRQG